MKCSVKLFNTNNNKYLWITVLLLTVSLGGFPPAANSAPAPGGPKGKSHRPARPATSANAPSADSLSLKEAHREGLTARPKRNFPEDAPRVYAMDTVRVYGTRPPFSEFDLASHITRLTVRDLAPGASLPEALSAVSGVFLKEYGAGEGLKTISLRGMGAEHTLILLDGVPLNNPQLGSVNLADYSLSDLAEIEIYRGGQSTLFGSGAVGGVVNLRSAWKNHLELGFASETGSYGYVQNSLKLNLPAGHVTQALDLAKNSSPNGYRFQLSGSNVNRLNSDFDKHRFDYRLLFQPSRNHSLTFQAFSFRNSHGAPRAVTAPNSFQGRARLAEEELLYKLKWNFHAAAGREWQVQLYRRRDWMDYRDPDLVINNRALKSHHFDDEYGFLAQSRFRIGPKLHLLGGLDGRYSRVKSSETLAKQRRQLAIYLLSEWTFWNRKGKYASLNVAARQENYSDFGSVFLPRAGIQVTSPKGKIYFSAGRNYRAPTFNDLYWQPGGNPDLRAEKSVSLEAGFAYRWQFLAAWEMEFSAYRTRLTDMIRWAPVNGLIWRPQNLDRVLSRGVEVHLRGEWRHPRLRLTLNYKNGLSRKENGKKAGDVTRGNRLPYLPAVEVNSSLQGRVRGFDISVGVNYLGFRYTSLANLSRDVLPANTLVNAAFSRTLPLGRYRISAYVRVNNLLSTKYQLIRGYPMPLQIWKFGMRITFLNKH